MVPMPHAPLKTEVWMLENTGSQHGLAVAKIPPDAQATAQQTWGGGAYRARSRRSSFSRICTVMAMLWEGRAVSELPPHFIFHQELTLCKHHLPETSP